MNISKVGNLLTKGVNFVKDKDTRLILVGVGGIVGCYVLERVLTKAGIMTPPQRNTVPQDQDNKDVEQMIEEIRHDVEEIEKTKSNDTTASNIVDIEG